MSIKISIKKNEEEQKEKKSSISFNAQIRKSLDGNIMVFDHEDVDIIIMPSNLKILVYPDEIMSDRVYATQNRLFKYLTKKGIVDPSTIHAGNIYGSMEAQILSGEANSIDLTLINVLKWIEEEKPYFIYIDALEDQYSDRLTDPDEKESTELGEIPQRPQRMDYNPYYSLSEQKKK